MAQELTRLKSLIRTIPDFPKPGIQFRDVSTLIQDAWGLHKSIQLLADHFKKTDANKIVAIEARGFILGGAIAQAMNCGLVMARKKGKLPAEVEEIEYALEYGTDCIQIHRDAIQKNDRVIVVDDLLATGGTCEATCELVERLGGTIAGCGFIINLPELAGHQRLKRYNPHWLVEFEGH